MQRGFINPAILRDMAPPQQPEMRNTPENTMSPLSALAGHRRRHNDDSDSTYSEAYPVSSAQRHSQALLDEIQELRQMVASLSERINTVTLSPTSPGGNNGPHQLPLPPQSEGLASELNSEKDSVLDPQSNNFDMRQWLQMFTQAFNDQGHNNKGLRTGVVFKNLSVTGSGNPLQLQDTVADTMLQAVQPWKLIPQSRGAHKKILRGFNGIIGSGELLLVLGRPGAGCSTLLKSLCGELHGLSLSEKSVIHYNGIPQQQMTEEFKGELTYNQEVDKHFPHLTVGQTLEFAAACRTPSHRSHGMSREEFRQHMVQVVMAVCGLTHTYNTIVGNDFVRGVSGGERKRVSIAEMMLAGSSMSSWDNSTRGLDSATALKFVENLRIASDLGGIANAVAIYQASQAIYDLFDKTTLLYEGRQVYFGPADQARDFFERQGWYCPPRQTTADFLTSITNPVERRPRQGMEDKVPRTPEEFQQYWRNSPEFKALQKEITHYEGKSRASGMDQVMTAVRTAKTHKQHKHVRPRSPYTISIPMQVQLTTIRAYQRMWNDRTATVMGAAINVILSLLLGSVFYGAPDTTDAIASKGAVIAFAVIVNALSAMNEISVLYAQRPIVEKHASWAFYHPATEAIAGIVADIPIKFILAVAFNTALYFLAGLKRTAGQFFIFFLINFIITFVMSGIFKTLAAATKTVAQAMMLAGVMVLALVVYTGYFITVPNMVDWFGWIRWINPVFYAFEILVANEFHGSHIVCPGYRIVPEYGPSTENATASWICSVLGAVPGQTTVDGDLFILQNYNYTWSHAWRNFGILIAFLIGFMTLFVVATEINSKTDSAAEVLVFQKGHVPRHMLKKKPSLWDEEAWSESTETGINETGTARNMAAIAPHQGLFTWRDVVYDIEIKGEPRRLLDNVSGWVKPGTLTALMGVSGAGKTTLLDVLAQRTTMGVITGDMFVNGKPLDASFQRKTGYVQQQDLHLETATVRESLQFSAMLRQPHHVSKADKYAFVEEVIKMLNMEDFANAVVGVPGQGLNVEQRKLLTIGVELAARPKLLLFLDEPTSGLDSQSSWAICDLLRKLADAGQAVLCTIHQPSALLFQQFDRLLFLARGGKTVYFGDIGQNSRTLLDYFESKGARECGDQENPAEYMLEIVNAGTNPKGEDWHSLWNASNERQAVNAELERIHLERQREPALDPDDANDHAEFATPFTTQLQMVTYRVFQQYWRMPEYIFSKWGLATAGGLFVGFTFFDADISLAGSMNIIFGIFMILTMFSPFIQQIIPRFVVSRALYEVRERPSKAYSWKAFLLAQMVVELPYQIISGLIVFACVYYPISGVQSSDRQVLVMLFIIQLFIYNSTVAHLLIAGLPDAESASAVLTLLLLMTMMFCGVFQPASALPGFWIFMYRLSPFTYWIGGIVGTILHGQPITCSETELSIFDPPPGQTCIDYLRPYLQVEVGGAPLRQLLNQDATSGCQVCSLSNADQYLAPSDIFWDDRWRNFGIMWAYIVFNVGATILVYYLARVAKFSRKK